MNKDKNLLLSNFFHTCSIPMAICDLELKFIEVNSGILRVLSCEKDAIVGKTMMDVTHKGDVTIDFQKFEALLKEEIGSYTLSRRYKTPDGGSIDGAITVSLFKQNGKKYLLGLFHEIIDEKVDYNFFKDNQETLNSILSLNPDLHYILDIGSKKYIYQNENILEYFGYSEADLNGKKDIEFLISKIDENSIMKVANANEIFKNEKSIGEFVEVEYKIKTKDEKWKWLKARSTPLVQDEDGRIKISYGILQDITEAKEVENQLLTQQEFIEEVANFVPDVIYVYELEGYKTIYNNLKNRSFLGYSGLEWATPGTVLPHPDFLKIVDNLRESLLLLKEDELNVVELVYLTKEGENHWLQFKSKIFKRDENGNPTQVLGTITDINDYKITLEQLALSEATTNAILKSIPDLILVVNREGDYMKTFSGHRLKTTTDLEGLNIRDIIKEPTATQIIQKVKECLVNNEAENIEFEHYEVDYKVNKYYSNSFSKISDDQVLILARDITQRKITELELEKKMDLLSVQNEQLEKFINKNLELERFAYIVSHDLKEPLRSISSLTEIIGQRVGKLEDGSLNVLMDNLIESSNRMHTMIQGVLEYSKVDSGMQVHKFVNLNEVLINVQKDLKTLISETKTELLIPDLPEVLGNQIQLRQLFQNLINNGIKFNKTDPIKIELDFKEINNGADIQFSIKDNGIGIEEKFRTSIFKMFKKINSKKAYAGQGLGLTICKKIVDQHEGEIWVEGNESGGSTFFFTINSDIQ